MANVCLADRASSSSTVVECLRHHHKVKDSSPGTAVGAGSEKRRPKFVSAGANGDGDKTRTLNFVTTSQMFDHRAATADAVLLCYACNLRV
jgi:hypothetical protein